MSASPQPGRQPASHSRWHQRSTSEYAWEQAGLDFIKRHMPDVEPYRAWATFTFTAASGRINECDLLIAVPSGLYLLELKAHPGRVTNTGSAWQVRATDGKVRTLENPLELTDLKAKELKGQLARAAHKRGLRVRIPWIQPVVFLTDPGLKSDLDEFQQPHVYTRNIKSGLPAVWEDLLARPPHRESHRITGNFASKVLPDLLKTIGINASAAHLRFGDEWKLAPRPLDAGNVWEDRLAERDDGQFREEGRVRIYLVKQGASASDAQKVKRAAQREYQVLQGINHRGIVQAVQFREHQGHPAILFRHAKADQQLDTYLATFGKDLTPETRLDMVRQLAEALRYAHNRSLYHRALSPRSIYVSCRPDGTKPTLRLTDWQTAARDFETTSLGSIGDSSLDDAFIEDIAQCYLAPEVDQPYPDPVDLDVFSLGSVAYLILTGTPPATNRAELKERLSTENGLLASADDDSLPGEINDLIRYTTCPDVANRLESADGFLSLLDDAEKEVAAPAGTSSIDPLTATTKQELDDGWEVAKILGTGATARAILVERLTEELDGELTHEQRVFKIALDEEKAERLYDEARALHLVGGGSIVQLKDGPRELGGRTVLELEFAGQKTLGKRLRDEGKLSYHHLERYGGDLFRALDQLDANGVQHRDIKPDNLGIFERKDRKTQLKLFDFSLTNARDTDIKAGTRGYLDPFIGSPRRPAYDAHAERYAAAVTLYEMASGERVKWGDDLTAPDMTDDELPRIEADLFEPALRDGLTSFFQRALHRDAEQRFDTLRQMEDAWRSVFAAADAASPATTPATVEKTESEEKGVEQVRDAAAEAATLDTPLDAAGLSPRAVSVANSYGATTVRDLLNVPRYQISRARGAGQLTRKELNRRHKQWETRLLKETGAAPSQDTVPEHAPAPLIPGKLSIDDLAARLRPQKSRKGSKRPDVERLALGLPDDDGTTSPLDAWPTQSAIAAHLGVSQPSVSRHFVEVTKAWRSTEWLVPIRRELTKILEDLGRVATASEVASELRAQHGTTDEDQARTMRDALAVVRAATEAELAAEYVSDTDDASEPRIAVVRRSNVVVLAAESLAGSEEPSPQELADYAMGLGRVADRLAALDPLPGSSAVLRELRSVAVPEGMRPLADTRLVALAAGLAQHAAASRRLELYPRDLELARALRISQAGAGIPEKGITLKALLAKVRARFPDVRLGEPTYVEVEEALASAGSRLSYDAGRGVFTPPAQTWRRGITSTSSSYMSSLGGAASKSGQDPVEAISAQLSDAATRGGFLALTIRAKYLPGAVETIAQHFTVTTVDLNRLFIDEFRALASEKNQAWDKVLAADARVSKSGTMSRGLGSYVQSTWQRVRDRLAAIMETTDTESVLFLHDAGLLGRYFDNGGRQFLTEIQNAARRATDRPHGLWLLCPAEAPRDAP
ncbi:MAG: BREX system serine/threonine kinase PglW, partial [Actinomycetota bacterium]|nr:BREX system serine/threonine kinase PglW [Actinomycetota bacterium]